MRTPQHRDLCPVLRTGKQSVQQRLQMWVVHRMHRSFQHAREGRIVDVLTSKAEVHELAPLP